MCHRLLKKMERQDVAGEIGKGSGLLNFKKGRIETSSELINHVFENRGGKEEAS